MDPKNVPRFRSDIHNSMISAMSSNDSRQSSLSPPSRGREGFWNNEQTKHLYEAMKKAREEIAESIRKRKLICFETVPMNFEDEGYSGKPQG